MAYQAIPCHTMPGHFKTNAIRTEPKPWPKFVNQPTSTVVHCIYTVLMCANHFKGAVICFWHCHCLHLNCRRSFTYSRFVVALCIARPMVRARVCVCMFWRTIAYISNIDRCYNCISAEGYENDSYQMMHLIK